MLWRMEERAVQEVLGLLSTSHASLCRWIRRFNTEGLEALKAKKGGGRKA